MTLAINDGPTKEELRRLRHKIDALLDKTQRQERRLHSVKQTCQICNMSLATFWRRAKEFELRKIGRRTFVTDESIERFLSSLPEG
jgi:predicted DNA-binding transcriptional regulator AlpA